MANADWCVVVFKCTSDKARDVLVDFYDFVADLEGVENLHFLLRDRVDVDVVFSFRVLVKAARKKTVMSKINYKLRSLVPEDRFAIDPSVDNPLQKYVAWSAKGGIQKHGREKFGMFCDFLSQLSKTVVDMAKRGYFNSSERVEMAHVMSWMLGCTEYGLLTMRHIEVGYYDRIADRQVPYMRRNLGE